jgi:hypothetical protein
LQLLRLEAVAEVTEMPWVLEVVLEVVAQEQVQELLLAALAHLVKEILGVLAQAPRQVLVLAAAAALELLAQVVGELQEELVARAVQAQYQAHQ